MLVLKDLDLHTCILDFVHLNVNDGVRWIHVVALASIGNYLVGILRILKDIIRIQVMEQIVVGLQTATTIIYIFLVEVPIQLGFELHLISLGLLSLLFFFIPLVSDGLL